MDFNNVIRSRRSERKFNGEPLSEQEMSYLLEAAKAAPVGRKRYDIYKLIVITDKEMLRRIDSEAAKVIGGSSHPLYNASAYIIICADAVSYGRARTVDASVGCIAENMTLAATDLGIGSVLIWNVVDALEMLPDLRKELGITDRMPAHGSVAFGKMDEALHPRDIPEDRIQTVII